MNEFLKNRKKEKSTSILNHSIGALNYKLLTVLFLVFTNVLCAQHSKYSIEIGGERSLLGTGDIPVISVNGELGRKLSNHFSVGLHVGYGTNLKRFNVKSLTFWKTNLNLYFNLFKKQRFYSPKIGVGLSYHNAQYLKQISSRIGFVSRNSNSFGYNLIISNKFRINPKHSLVVYIFTSPYFNGNINSGFGVSWSINFKGAGSNRSIKFAAL